MLVILHYNYHNNMTFSLLQRVLNKMKTGFRRHLTLLAVAKMQEKGI